MYSGFDPNSSTTKRDFEKAIDTIECYAENIFERIKDSEIDTAHDLRNVFRENKKFIVWFCEIFFRRYCIIV